MPNNLTDRLGKLLSSYNDKIKALETENKKLLVKAKKIDNLTTNEVLQLLLDKLLKRS